MFEFKTEADFEVIALGRSTVDIYALDVGPLEEAGHFARYLGGSPANTAVALAKLQNRVGFIGKVSADGLGSFVRRYLKQHGIDVSQLHTDHEGHRTGITVGEIKEGGSCSCLMYRDNCADLFLRPEEIDGGYIAKAKALLVSGTSLSHSPAREAVFKAVRLAHDAGTAVIFDPDFRQGTWNSEAEAACCLLLGLLSADIVIGTREEFALPFAGVLPANFGAAEIAHYLLRRGPSLVVIKDGSRGSTAYSREEAVESPSYHIDGVVKTFGAGDAYAAGLLTALLQKRDLKFAQAQGAAAAALTIRGHSCSDASPDLQTLQQFMQTHQLG